ncbi:MAG: hypothetical protein H0T79_02590 [Deltaproteobacteria bacterium]|nr:hypothetical protein [Deltaproteobacteria bacterium]
MALFMDQLLARRLERAEGAVGTTFTAVRQRFTPEVDATWQELDGTYAIFDGVGSPFTQSFGLGLFAPVTHASLARLEAFFEDRGAPAVHEVSPLAGIATFGLLVERGYQPVELGSVLVQALDNRAPSPSTTLRARRLEDREHAAWIDASTKGWSDEPGMEAIVRSIAEAAARNQAMAHFLVERDGVMIATGSMGIHEGVALLAGASTIPAGRGMGAQGVLLAARLDEAHRRGCEVAMMVATPGSTSQRNAERRGFQVAYTRTKWQRSPALH